MSLGKRLALIFKAKASKALDRAEDPRETLDYSYQKQLEMLQQVPALDRTGLRQPASPIRDADQAASQRHRRCLRHRDARCPARFDTVRPARNPAAGSPCHHGRRGPQRRRVARPGRRVAAPTTGPDGAGLPRDTAPHRPAADHAHPALRRPDLRGRRSGAHRHPQPRRPRPAAHPPDRRQGVLRREDLPHRRFAFGSLSLPTIKAIKNEMPGATVNDVVVAVCAGALRRRMLARGDDVDTALVAMVPVSVRTAHEHYGNQISSMIVAIPSHEPHPRARLEHAHEAMRSAKELHRGIPAQLLREANHTVPPALFTRTARMISTTAAIGWIAPPFNVTISSIPGSPTPLYCAGARVVSQHPVNVLIDGLGLSLTLLSYEDHVDFGLTADRALVPDVWHLETDMRAELDTLAKEFGVENA